MTHFRFGRTVKPHERWPVAWYHPMVLLRTACDILSSLNQFRNGDPRDGLAQPLTVIDRSQGTDQDFWFDFIADTGDGGNATYAVALTALSDHVDPLDSAGDGPLLRGELLLLGGDLAYPSASALEYRYRFTEMFEAALPAAADGPSMGRSQVRGKPLTVAALPQNHDWMDQASTFGRYFIRNKDDRAFLGADIPQKQSYFCVRLPHGWWALGLDFAMTDDIDRDQFLQFAALLGTTGLQTTPADGHSVCHRILPSDRVLLIYPVPIWTTPVSAGVYPGGALRYQRLEGLLGDRIALRLSGDLHHYMRWTAEHDGQLVTCGTGGAFAHPTHTRLTTAPVVVVNADNADAIPASPCTVVRIGLDDGQVSGGRPFTRVKDAEWPPVAVSRRMALGNLTALFGAGETCWQGNRWFAALLGGLYGVGALLNLLPWGEVLTFAMVGAFCLAIGMESLVECPPKWPTWCRWLFTLVSSLTHGACHVMLLICLAQAFENWQAVHAQAALVMGTAGISVVWGLWMGCTGALAGTCLFGAYLAIMSWYGWLTTNAYSAMAVQNFKGLLRFKISQHGALHGYFIAIDTVPLQWALNTQPQPVWRPVDRPLAARVHDRFVIHPVHTSRHHEA